MDNFYKQFFGKDEYPPDKKHDNNDDDDDLESTVDDRSSHIGNEKYQDLHSLNLGPPSHQPPAGSKKGDINVKEKEMPRETYLRTDDPDETIKPKRELMDEGEWPPRNEELTAPAMGDFGESKPQPPPIKHPRITYYDASQPPTGRRPPPGPSRRPNMPQPVRRQDTPPGFNRRPSPSPNRRPPPGPNRPPPGSNRPPPPNHRRPPPPGSNRRPPSPYGRPNMPPPHMSEKMPPPGHPRNRRQNTDGEIVPYVGKWGMISRSWASQTVILIIFMGVGYIMMADSAQRLATEAALTLNYGCSSVDTAANAIVNAPGTVALATITMVESAAENAIAALGRTLNKIISMLRDLIVWVLKLYIGTFICFATLIVKTALNMITEASRILTEKLEIAVNEVVGELQNVAATIADGIENVANDIVNFFTGNKDGQTVDFNTESIKEKLTITIPTDWIDSIANVANLIPTEDQIFGNISDLIDVPFGMLRSLVTGAFAGIHVNIVDDVNIVTDKKANICVHPMGQDTINELGINAARIMYICGMVLVGVAVGIILFKALWSMREESQFRRRLVAFRSDLVDYRAPVSKRELHEKPATREEMDLFVLPGQPMLQRFTDFIVKKYGDTERTAAWRWWLHYVWHPPAIACFVAGAFGLAAIIVQVQAINAMRREFIPMLAQELDNFQNDALNEGILGGARTDAINTAANINSHIESAEKGMTDSLFGPLTEGTTSINDTLNEFVGTYIGGIRDVFGGTPLQDPIEGIVNCTLTKNIQSIQKILTFVNDFTDDIQLPRVSAHVLYAPVAALTKPLNLTASALRELAVGVYVANADQLDPESFLPQKDIEYLLSKLDSKLLSSEDELSGLEGESSDLSSLESLESEVIDVVGTDEPVADGGAGNLRKRQDNLPTDAGDFHITQLIPSLPVGWEAEDGGELNDLGDDSSSLYYISEIDMVIGSEEPVATSELSREEVEDAQDFNGYTGGAIGKLCDMYINNLMGGIPMMIALMLVWVIIAIVGAVKVAKDYSHIKKHNLR
ncbi:plasma membrane fusion protein prm1 [Coemansia sp. RSA 353]|nr:plasma membrane fusion protein prm1 [Coemansia sp. RSA 564]KAJ2168599.1 plasma membrane fusion protein prm1 [Coemansia sp. RSA 562]KAJ2181589.1 plasma membrane fusion protein prm1 [Coemansia sp. RSA 551]KAJ2194939.1 plasma membrane fusion protein prm1 [Coemansia sp. RSA 530]KAJ2248602.1 plasma membrane fusion protein prm1 [Coemansia sp. RSA 475]KAJ2293058.1 plasma membrane fusion protein prm1 [Coemansia sp. RSA 355]KAJ2301763.1 plasma membrane fusion protein prm1 [Coemansia sp. RSA 353]KA